MGIPATPQRTKCHHCQEDCQNDTIVGQNGHLFCCQGCATVYQLLAENGMLDFYALDNQAGKKQKESFDDYDWLQLPELADRFIQYQDKAQTRITLELPDIHCLSCVWLLENLNKIAPGIIRSEVNYSRKRAILFFNHLQISLPEVARLLSRIGYPPKFERADKQKSYSNQGLYLRLGLAGFAFGNIMLLSFPEYFGIAGDLGSGLLSQLANYLMLALSIPVLLYGGSYYLNGAYQGLKQSYVSFDVPIALGMLSLFGWSAYEILLLNGAGYLDSLAGLIFFLLIGRWFQSLTYDRLNFERDYQDYFPVAAYAIQPDGQHGPIPTDEIQIGTKLLVKPGQLIPADGVLTNDTSARIDYSFVTGEVDPQRVVAGGQLYAGGRAVDRPLRIMTTATARDSYLLQLWRETDQKTNSEDDIFTAKVSKYFTLTVVSIAFSTLIYWSWQGADFAVRAAIAVLIIACPCALALAKPFAYGTMMRLLAQDGLYCRSSKVLDKMSQVDHFVFDKTGTLLATDAQNVQLKAHLPAAKESAGVFLAMARQSQHPKSQQISRALAAMGLPTVSIDSCKEVIGEGLVLQLQGDNYRIGSARFCALAAEYQGTFLVKNGHVHYELMPAANSLRPGTAEMLAALRPDQKHLISGDQSQQTAFWEQYFRSDQLHFNQSPFDKKRYLSELKAQGHFPVMIGDGLNDTGALQEAHLGIAVSEDIADFSPASDAILLADRLATSLAKIKATKSLPRVLKVSYGLAFLYNIVGLYFAVSGQLSPVVAAILMPLSSVSVVGLAVGLSVWEYRRGE